MLGEAGETMKNARYLYTFFLFVIFLVFCVAMYFTFNNKEYEIVQDDNAPEISCLYIAIDLIQGTNLDAYDFDNFFVIYDDSDFSYTVTNTCEDSNITGSYLICIEAIDVYENTSIYEIILNITQSPTENQELIIEEVFDENNNISIVNNLIESTEEIEIIEEPEEEVVAIEEDTPVVTPDDEELEEEIDVQDDVLLIESMTIASSTTSAIVVIGQGGSKATLTFYSKKADVWQETLSCSAYVGKNGISSSKVEGDGMTPSGIYSLGQAFGVSSNPGYFGDWLQVNSNHYWVDDVTSAYYNQLVDLSEVEKDWTSAEHLIDYATQYKYSVAINYNQSCVAGQGSAIFLHCNGSSGYTFGCVSVSESNMISILQLVQSDTLIGIYTSSNIY